MKLSERSLERTVPEVEKIMPLVDKIEELRPTMQAMTDEELKDQTRKFKGETGRGRDAG